MKLTKNSGFDFHFDKMTARENAASSLASSLTGELNKSEIKFSQWISLPELPDLAERGLFINANCRRLLLSYCERGITDETIADARLLVWNKYWSVKDAVELTHRFYKWSYSIIYFIAFFGFLSGQFLLTIIAAAAVALILSLSQLYIDLLGKRKTQVLMVADGILLMMKD